MLFMGRGSLFVDNDTTAISITPSRLRIFWTHNSLMPFGCSLLAGRQVLNNCVAGHTKRRRRVVGKGSKGIFEVSTLLSIGNLPKWNQHNLSVFHNAFCNIKIHTSNKTGIFARDTCHPQISKCCGVSHWLAKKLQIETLDDASIRGDLHS